MRFDFVIGNPPFQEESENTSSQNGQAPRKSIFQYLQMAADDIAEKGSVLVYPGGRWIQRSGKGMKKFGYEQINDKHLKDVYFYPDASDLFPSIALADGMSIVVKDRKKTTQEFNYVYCQNGNKERFKISSPGEEILPLKPTDFLLAKKFQKFIEDNHLRPLQERVLPRTLFGVESNFVEEHPELVEEYHGQDFNIDQKILLLTNDKAGKAGRAKWYIVEPSVIPSNRDLIAKYKVIVSSANAGGQKRDRQLELLDGHAAFGRSRVALGLFDTKAEAENFLHYVSSIIIQFAFLLTDESLTTLGMRVPDFKSYLSNETSIDFDSDIDKQLQEAIGFTDEEVSYMKDTVENLRK